MIILILLAGLILRLVSLDQSLWLDEATSVLVARNLSFSQIVGAFSPGDFHPPFYYLFLKIWITIFGSNEIAVRTLSVLFGTATVYLVYLIGQRLFSKSMGLVAALLLATAPLHIYYSQETRMYVLATFLTCLAAFFFTGVLRQPTLAHWLELVLAIVLLLYTDYPPVFFVVALGLYLLLSEREHFRKHFAVWVLSALSVVFLYIPWLPTLSSQLQAGLLVKTNAPEWWQILGRTSLKQIFLVPVKFTVGRISSYDKILYGVLISFPLVLFGALFVRALHFFGETKFLWTWLVIPILLGAVVGLRLSIFSYFRLLFVLPAFYLLAAYAALSFGKKSKIVVWAILLINVVASALYLANPRFHREDWRGAISWVEQQPIGKTAASIFVTKNQRDPYFYYAKRIPAYGPEGLEQGNFDTIYLFRYVQPIFDPQDRVGQKIEQVGYKKKEEHDSGGIVVWKYTK